MYTLINICAKIHLDQFIRLKLFTKPAAK